MDQDLDKKIIEEANKKAEKIAKDAVQYRRQIQSASLEYVDDMLLEVSIAAKKAKENIRIIFERTMEDLDERINQIEADRQKIIEDLNLLSEYGIRPQIRDGSIAGTHSEMKAEPVNKTEKKMEDKENPVLTQAYEIRIRDGAGEKKEVYRPAKQPYEIKIAEEWKERIESMYEPLKIEEEEPPAEEEEEIEEGFSAADFDLDSEYFNWLESKEDR